MVIPTGMETIYPALLVAAVGIWVMATAAYAKVPRKNTYIKSTTSTTKYWATSTDTEYTIASYYRDKYHRC